MAAAPSAETTPKGKRTRRMSGSGFQEEEHLEDVSLDEGVDSVDPTDDEDDEFFERSPLGSADGRARPIWLCAGDTLLWCNPRFGHHLRFRETLRRLLETFLGNDGLRSMGKPFDSPDIEERLFLLLGFFREVWLRNLFKNEESDGKSLSDEYAPPEEEDSGEESLSDEETPPEDEEYDGEARPEKTRNKSVSLQSRLRSLNSVGMRLPGGEVLPLSLFLAGKGERTESVPRRLERRWIRDVFRERGLDAGFKWKDVKEWLPSEYEHFVESLRSLLQRSFPGIEKEKLPGNVSIGTLQKKKLKVFRGYLLKEMGTDEDE